MRIRSTGLRSLACLPLLASALLPLGAAHAATTVHDVTAYGAVKDDQVDLGSNYQISDIALWDRDRNDCCPERLSKYYVFVSAQPFASESVAGTLAQPGVHAYYSDLAAGRPSGFAVNTTGRYVRVQLTSKTDPLSLAEVQVFSPDRAGGLPGAAGGSSRAARGQ